MESTEQFSGKSFETLAELAETLANDYLQKNGKVILRGPYANQYLFNKPLYEFNPKVEITDKAIKLTVENTYYTRDFQALDLKLSIVLLRISTHIGYSIDDILVTQASLRSNSISDMEGKL